MRNAFHGHDRATAPEAGTYWDETTPGSRQRARDERTNVATAAAANRRAYFKVELRTKDGQNTRLPAQARSRNRT
jgi:hypothetical protein